MPWALHSSAMACYPFYQNGNLPEELSMWLELSNGFKYRVAISDSVAICDSVALFDIVAICDIIAICDSVALCDSIAMSYITVCSCGTIVSQKASPVNVFWHPTPLVTTKY